MLAFFKVTLNTHSDLSNFCFQIFCLFICLNSNPAQHYIQIYESILDPNNWCEDNSSMMSAYVQYLTTFLLAVPDRITSDKPSF